MRSAFGLRAWRWVLIFATFVAAGPAFAGPSSSEADKSFARGHEHFQRGVSYLDAEKPEAAAEEFELSLKEHETMSALYNLSVACRDIGQLARAERALQRWFAIARDDDPKEKATALLEDVRSRYARITLKIGGGATQILVNGRSIAQRDGKYEQRLEPGKYEILVSREGYAPVKETVVLEPKAQSSLMLMVDKTPLFARISVDTGPVDATLHIDGLPVGHRHHEGTLDPGEHVIAATAKGYLRSERRLAISPGEHAKLTIDMSREPPPPEGLTQKWWFWPLIVSTVVVGTVVTLAVVDPLEPRYDLGTLGVGFNALSPSDR